ncbi:threonine/homoserine/homoserine lactone efflux protein [Dysgonomonadaceae bacterium PH5-43]|nr:threonine/homoserine/homoserine lactone efflux protein [Dysgonomonadaceae bacterium PH5-43]
MFDIIYKGIIIGIFVSAPMGPIGLLCIQRTLNKGRWHGFCSGIGATFSDLIYAIITCMGMGFVISFIENHQSVLQIIGSILLMVFGIYTFRSNPSRNLKKPNLSSSTYYQDIVTAFFLTLSNPFIIFLYIALFARFNFIIPDDKLYSMILGLLGIVSGALLWWFIITYFVSKLRSVFNVRGLWIMNRIIGTIIMILSLIGLFYSIWDMNSLY